MNGMICCLPPNKEKEKQMIDNGILFHLLQSDHHGEGYRRFAQVSTNSVAGISSVFYVVADYGCQYVGVFMDEGDYSEWKT